MTRIYVYHLPHPHGRAAHALAETGELIVTHVSSAGIFVPHDMGLGTSRRQHRYYAEACPDGYELIDLTKLTQEELTQHRGLTLALARAEEAHEDQPDSGPDAGDPTSTTIQEAT